MKLYSGDADSGGFRRWTPLDADADRLSEAAIATVYHKEHISPQTKLRKFASCPFSYTCDDRFGLPRTDGRNLKIPISALLRIPCEALSKAA